MGKHEVKGQRVIIQVVEVQMGEEMDGVGPFVGGGSPGRGLRDAWGFL